MKELLIEEKAKAYDKVREKIALRFGSNVAEEIFFEFEEPEDERIRKLCEVLVRRCFVNELCTKEEKDGCIAWLENTCQSIL